MLRRIAQHSARRGDQPALAVIPLDRDGHRLVDPADHQAGMHPGLDVEEIATGDHVARDHAVERLVERRAARHVPERSAPLGPGERRGPIATPGGAVATARVRMHGEIGRLMNASHASLRDDYEVTVEAVDRLVADLQADPRVFGARMTGAGFGGACVALVEHGTARTIKAKIAAATGAAGPRRRVVPAR
ncbi:MAG: hypothetical protein ACXWU2_05635 [Allosphingosinicella sp.]